MKKYLLRFISPFVLLCLFYLTEANPAFAQVSQCPPGFTNLCSTAIFTSGPGVAIAFIIAFSIIASLIVMILGGIRWITSGGDKQKMTSARSTIIAAIVGLIISLASFFIVNFVMGVLLGQSVNNIAIPKLVP